jgi:3-oxoacyl-[acyl-carrier protein] reductase
MRSSETGDPLIDYAAGRFTGPLLRRLGLPAPRSLSREEGAFRVDALKGRSVVMGGLEAGYALGSAKQVLERMGASVSLAHDGSTAQRVDVAVFDATGCREVDSLRALYAFWSPLIRQLASCARLLVLAEVPGEAANPRERAAACAVDGFVRSLAKEVGRTGSTANLLRVSRSAVARLEGPVRFLCTHRSAYVSGQSVGVSDQARLAAEVKRGSPGLSGTLAVVTGAARGLGAATVVRLAEEGARVLCIDVPSAREPLHTLAKRVGGLALELDITAPNAGSRLVEVVRHSGSAIDVLVHNAGITRDRTLANMSDAEWNAVMAVNVKAVIELDGAIDAAHLLRDDAREICLSSITGIAGNFGQANYAASKAALIGYVSARADALAPRGITVNGVAPGFIETEMTQKMPLLIREAGRRLNALSQGGQPRDVAEMVCFLASPEAVGVTGQTLRVCGQALLGA